MIWVSKWSFNSTNSNFKEKLFWLDWNYLESTNPELKDNYLFGKDNYWRFVQKLRLDFDRSGEGWKITMPISVVAFRDKRGYNMQDFCKLIDHIHCTDCNYKTNSTIFGCPSSKLVVGVPLYARDLFKVWYLSPVDWLISWITIINYFLKNASKFFSCYKENISEKQMNYFSLKELCSFWSLDVLSSRRRQVLH